MVAQSSVTEQGSSSLGTTYSPTRAKVSSVLPPECPARSLLATARLGDSSVPDSALLPLATLITPWKKPFLLLALRQMSGTSLSQPYHRLALGLDVLSVRLQESAKCTLPWPCLAPAFQLCGLSAWPCMSGLCHLALVDVLLSNKVISHVCIPCVLLD